MAKTTQHNGRSLVIVESPAKAKTIHRYLGRAYTVKASMGHVRDLPTSHLGIDLENDFEPVYSVVPRRRKVLNELAKAARDADYVYLATDLDREGEAIAWHLAHALKLPRNKTRRVVFNEITKSAIKAAFDNPHPVDMNKVNAQQARRLLDRIVGYQLSPLLWKKIAKGLSAGRVQSVAVRLVVEREWDIRAFVPEESWRITGVFATDLKRAAELANTWEQFLEAGDDPDAGRTRKQRHAWLSEHGCLEAELVQLAGKEFKPGSAAEARQAAEHLGFVCEEVEQHPWEEYAEHGLKTVDLNGRTNPTAAPDFFIREIQTKQVRAKAPGPFITASLQQAASSTLGFSVSRTMRVAQQLYEGVDLGNSEGPVGLITYMRTDSTNLSKESVQAVRAFIGNEYGPKYVPTKPNVFGKAARAQEAHEAVRPSEATRHPDAVRSHLTSEQHKLYALIWKRFVACQMTPAVWDRTTLLISASTSAGEAIFRASGRRLVFDGHLRVTGAKNHDELVLPSLAKDDRLAPLQVEPAQHFTSPPPRFGEASLVKALESDGIGRPSTYAAIIQTIQDRGYVELVDKRFHATDKGVIVTEKLLEHFPKIMDVKFTSFMEDELDKIEEAHLDWVRVLHEFYHPFKEALDRAHLEMTPARAEPSEYKCPKCDKEMVYRWARTGRFLSCTGYPDCNGACNVGRDGTPLIQRDLGIKCALCDKEMILRQSRHGPFLGCSGYPECTNTIACDETGVPLKLVTEKELERPCEACGHGTMTVRRRGARAFLGCDQYPKCRNTASLPDGVRLEKKIAPVEQAGFDCEKCGKPMHVKTGRRGKFIACSGFPRCRNAKPFEKLDEFLELARAGKLVADEDDDDDGDGTETTGKKKSSRTAKGKKKKAASSATAKKGKTSSSATAKKGKAGSTAKAARRPISRNGKGKVDLDTLGPPPPGYAWTRTGRPVVETWPEDMLACPKCGSEMVLRNGRFGPFYSCSGFPKCKCSVNLRGEAKKQAEIEMPAPPKPKPIPTDVPCDECGENMVIRTGHSGQFLGCSKYPKCKFTKPLPDELAAQAPATS